MKLQREEALRSSWISLHYCFFAEESWEVIQGRLVSFLLHLSQAGRNCMRAGNRERSTFREGEWDTAFPDNTQPKGKRGLVGSLLFSLHGGHGRERRSWLNISAPFLILNQNNRNSLVGGKNQNNKKQNKKKQTTHPYPYVFNRPQ